MEIFSIRLKEERIRNTYTQKEMADLLEITLRAYQNYEALSKRNHREPNFELLVKMADILEVKLDYLLGREY